MQILNFKPFPSCFLHFKRLPVKVTVFILNASEQCYSALAALAGKQKNGAAFCAEPEGGCLQALSKPGGRGCCGILWGIEPYGLVELVSIHTATIVQEVQQGPLLAAHLEQAIRREWQKLGVRNG